MGMGGKIIIIFVLSLFFSTFFISYFDEGFNGYSRVKVITLPRSASDFSDSANFKSACNLTPYETDGSWGCSGSGLELTGGGSLLVPLNSKTNDGVYTSSYHITSHDSVFYIVIAETNYDNYIHLIVENDKIWIPKVISAGWAGRYEYGTAWYAYVDGSGQNIQIDTRYDSNSNEVSIVFNGETFNIPEGLPSNTWMPQVLTSTTGISSDGSLTLESISYDFQSRTTEISQALDGLAMVKNIAFSMARLATYTFPYDILPLTLQFAIIFPQEFCIIMGVAIFLREG